MRVIFNALRYIIIIFVFVICRNKVFYRRRDSHKSVSFKAGIASDAFMGVSVHDFSILTLFGVFSRAYAGACWNLTELAFWCAVNGKYNFYSFILEKYRLESII